MTPPYDEDERQNIVGDIARWKVELEEVGGGKSFPDEKLTEYIEDLYERSDEAFKAHWDNTVRIWVTSRSDMPVPDDVDHDEWLEEQFTTLCNGENPPWGYISWFEVPSKAELTE